MAPHALGAIRMRGRRRTGRTLFVARALHSHSAVMARRSTKLRRNTPIDVTQIEKLIYLIRGQRVMLDRDLANIYGVTTSRFNEQIKRNSARFPSDFRFQLTPGEHSSLRSQFAILEKGRGRYRKYPPYAFTEHGAIMAASVLSSPQAVAMSIFVVRAFVRLRELLSTHHQLAAKLEELENRLTTHDEQIVVLFEAIRQLMEEPIPEKRRIGFGVEDECWKRKSPPAMMGFSYSPQRTH